ncbi:MAG: hypothetical protein ACJASR_002501 [Psychroserpens sp.]|jgi:hypothetical protein
MYNKNIDLNRKHLFLKKNLYEGLNNLNDGFDTLSIYYFNNEDFLVLLKRAKKIGVIIHGVETWHKGKFYDVLSYNDFDANFNDNNWYFLALEKFTRTNIILLYSASYYIPEELLVSVSKEDIEGK